MRKLGNASEIVFRVVFRSEPLTLSPHLYIFIEELETWMENEFRVLSPFGTFLWDFNWIALVLGLFECEGAGKTSFAGNGVAPGWGFLTVGSSRESP